MTEEIRALIGEVERLSMAILHHSRRGAHEDLVRSYALKKQRYHLRKKIQQLDTSGEFKDLHPRRNNTERNP